MTYPVTVPEERPVRFATQRTPPRAEVPATHELAALWRPGVPGAPALLCSHGMLSSKSSDKLRLLCEAAAAHGFATLRHDFSGRGESGGERQRITYTQEVADLRAASAFAVAQGCERLCLFGSSMGGAVSVLHGACEPRVVAVVTLAAVCRPGHWARQVPAAQRLVWQGLGSFPYDGEQLSMEYFDDAQQTDVLAAARALRAPLLVLHGQRDRVVPAEDGELLAAAAHAELMVFPEADHRFSRAEDLELALQRALAFFLAHR